MAHYRIIASRPAGGTDEDSVEAARAVLGEAGPAEVVWLSDGVEIEDLAGAGTLVVAGGGGTLATRISG
jgi:hypothetical protein